MSPVRRETAGMKPVPKLVAAASLALLAAACSGSPTPATSPSTVNYSHCMRSHDVPDYPDPASNGGLEDQRAGARGQRLPVPGGVERLPAPAPGRRVVA